MSHGIFAFQAYGNTSRSTIWDWAISSNDRLAVYANKRIRDPRGTIEDNACANAFREAIGGVKVLLNQSYVEEYAKFEPRNLQEFIHICNRCFGYSGGSSALVAPATITNQTAVRLLEDFHAISGRLELKSIKKRPVARIVKRMHVGIRWAYMLAFHSEMPYTFFVSDDTDVINSFEKHSRNYPNEYQIHEHW